MSGKSHC